MMPLIQMVKQQLQILCNSEYTMNTMLDDQLSLTTASFRDTNKMNEARHNQSPKMYNLLGYFGYDFCSCMTTLFCKS